MNLNRKVVLFIAMSLDGYIAREDGGLDWLYAVEGEGSNGFDEFYQTIDTILMGRKTYHHLLSLVSEYPHADRKTFVFSRSTNEQDPHVEYVSEEIPSFVRQLKQQEGSNIWLVGGSGLVDPFLKAKCVDEIILTIAPVILGNGIPLFQPNHPEKKLELKDTKVYGQFVQMHYVVR